MKNQNNQTYTNDKTEQWAADIEILELPTPKKIDDELRERSVCFTGHRTIAMPIKQLEEEIRIQIAGAWAMGYTHFICGGALGFDIIAAEQVLYVRKKHYPEITLEIAVPCTDQDAKWTAKQKQRYRKILENTASVRTTIVSRKEYSAECMRWRNEYMVDNCSLVIAYFTGQQGGTKQTIDYAKKQGRKIWFIE